MSSIAQMLRVRKIASNVVMDNVSTHNGIVTVRMTYTFLLTLLLQTISTNVFLSFIYCITLQLKPIVPMSRTRSIVQRQHSMRVSRTFSVVVMARAYRQHGNAMEHPTAAIIPTKVNIASCANAKHSFVLHLADAFQKCSDAMVMLIVVPVARMVRMMISYIV